MERNLSEGIFTATGERSVAAKLDMKKAPGVSAGGLSYA
jgi:hypothetical protein